MVKFKLPRVDWSPVELASRLTRRGVAYNFASGSPDPGLIPVIDVKEAAEDVLSEYGSGALSYPGAGGLRELRVEVSRYLREYLGINADWRSIIVTSGAQHAIKLLTQLLVRRGVRVYVEDPTFYETLSPFRFQGGRVIGVSLTNEGMLVNEVVKVIKEGDIVYTIPNCHNPTGVCMSDDNRRMLIEASEEKGFLIIEDDPYTVLSLKAPRPLRSVSSNVIYVGTFSKILGPGLRIGFIVAPNWLRGHLERLEQHDFSTSTLTQLIVYKLLRSNTVDKVLGKARGIYEEKLRTLINALDEYLPNALQFKPACGFYALVRLGVDAERLLRTTAKVGLTYVPARRFFINGGFPDAARLSIGAIRPERIEDGVKLLSSLIKSARSQ
ncbi:PLP-dependent aminotransferase family protein [Caldivirga maquilingensis]|nr:PLP-dependent aminotransferase family protein [Caldivirga maquilingensis]